MAPHGRLTIFAVSGVSGTFFTTWQKPPFCSKLSGLGLPANGGLTAAFGGVRMIAPDFILKGIYHAPHDHQANV